MSFDVKNLFTCIPIDLALQRVEERLNNPNLPENLKPIPSNALIYDSPKNLYELRHILME